MNYNLSKKVGQAVKLIQAAGKKADKYGDVLEICYSGGKDSDVILELAKMSGVEYRAIYKNTTIDPPGTIKHALEMGCEVKRPTKSFLELIAVKGFPSRKRRFCCDFLKEYKVLDNQVLGIRQVESYNRSRKYKEPEICRIYRNSVKARQYFPILEWSDKDIVEFINDRGIKCHSLYYDELGHFHPERRLGCMGCPLSNRKRRIEDFGKYPNLIKLYIRGGQRFLERHMNSPIHKMFCNVYGWFVCYLFCDNSLNDFNYKFGNNLFEKQIDFRQFLMNYFNIDL